MPDKIGHGVILPLVQCTKLSYIMKR